MTYENSDMLSSKDNENDNKSVIPSTSIPPSIPSTPYNEKDGSGIKPILQYILLLLLLLLLLYINLYY